MEYPDYASSAEDEFHGHYFGSISGIHPGQSLHIQGEGHALLGWKSEKNSDPPVAPRKIIKTFTVSDEESDLEVDVSVYGYLRSFKTEWDNNESNWKCKAKYFWWAEYE